VLFTDDVERLLRDLYGDVEGDAVETLRRAVFYIVHEVLYHVRKDIWQEHDDAAAYDYGMYGIGVPEGHGIHTSQIADALGAQQDLADRVTKVLKDPSAFSEYTVEFAKYFAASFEKVDEADDDTKSTDTPAVMTEGAAN